MKTDAFQQRLEMWFIQFSFKGYLDNEIISWELIENGFKWKERFNVLGIIAKDVDSIDTSPSRSR